MAGPAVGRLHPGRPGETKGQPKLVDVLSVRPRTRVRFPPPPSPREVQALRAGVLFGVAGLSRAGDVGRGGAIGIDREAQRLRSNSTVKPIRRNPPMAEGHGK